MPAAGSSPAFKPAAPAVILIAGCLIGMLTFGPRSALGMIQVPLITDYGWGRDVFSLGLAIQNLLWGIGQPFAGAIADRFGTARVLSTGIVLYSAGLVLMTLSSDPLVFHITAGTLIGLGLSGSAFTIVVAAFGKLLPEQWRSAGFGVATAAGSLGQFLFAPITGALLESLGWKGVCLTFAALMLLVLPLSLALVTPPADPSADEPGSRTGVAQTIADAFRHPSYVLLVLGFFTCGFQLAFITVHMPAYLKDLGLATWVGAWTLAAIGLFNIVGSLTAGWAGNRMPKRYILVAIYLARSLAIAAFIMLPASPAASIIFGAAMGLLWLSTIPPTGSLVALMFGTRYMAMLFGFAFFSHQVGGFLGVWLGGILYERFGSYDPIWWGAVALGLASAVINLPIIEKPAPARVKLAAA